MEEIITTTGRPRANARVGLPPRILSRSVDSTRLKGKYRASSDSIPLENNLEESSNNNNNEVEKLEESSDYENVEIIVIVEENEDGGEEEDEEGEEENEKTENLENKPVLRLKSKTNSEKRGKRAQSEKLSRRKPPAERNSTDEADPERNQRLQKMRQSIKELIDTEEIYIKDLYTMIEKIMKPMAEKRDYLTGELLVTKEQFTSIWSNITVLPGFNEVLLKELHKAAKEDDFQAKIGKVFIDIADYLKIYTQFCSNQPISNQTVLELRNNSQFDAFLMEKADVTVLEESHNLDLNAFLIKPIQRICKYPLFLREILNSSKSSDMGYILLEQAYEKINAVILSINEAKKLTENNAKLRDITQILYKSPTPVMVPSRKVVKYEVIKKIVAGKVQFRGTLFLFSDSLFVGKNDKRKQRRVKYITHFAANSQTTVTINDQDETNLSFMIAANNFKIICFVDNSVLRDNWITEINNTIDSNSKNSRTSCVF